MSMPPRRVSRVSLCLSLAATALIAGCGGETDERPRQAVSGEVKIDGGPLKSGMIQFNPTEPGLAVPGTAVITDGTYALSTSEGLVPGPYLVAVTSAPAPSTAPAAGTMPGDPVPPPKEPIPSIYNAKTELKANVTKEGPNTFNFELKSKPEPKPKSKSK
jgi:hypothetical protein